MFNISTSKTSVVPQENIGTSGEYRLFSNTWKSTPGSKAESRLDAKLYA
jgi:hypothetical protein